MDANGRLSHGGSGEIFFGSGTDIMLTYSGGTLQSADAVPGPWQNETGTSLLEIQPSAGRKFFRGRGN